MTPMLLAVVSESSAWQTFVNYCVIGLTTGSLFALIALGYTMVYGIIGLINFAHGDLFMLGAFLTLTVIDRSKLAGGSTGQTVGVIALALVIVPVFCATLNVLVDRIVYKPLRNAPKLAPLVSAIGVSFIFMNVGQAWRGAQDQQVPDLVSRHDLLSGPIKFTIEDLVVVGTVAPIMIALTLLVKFTRLGKAMRATSQDPVAAQLMGINVDWVICATFAIGGALAGAAAVIYDLYIRTINFQMGFQNGLYAFTAAVLGGIGSIPGAVLGGLIIGLVRALGSLYIGESWTSALVFAILILVLIFRPSGLLGSRAREKV